MILECRDLSKSFYTKKALNEVSLKLEGGKIYGLLGENGSGKTTWMKIISGLTKPTSGEILFKEHPWFYGDKAEIAYMSTEPFFYSFLDVNGVGQYYKDFFPDFDEKKFHEMVRRMSLEGKMKVKELSTGMTAKLKVIATFNGIDYKAKEEILGMILESANEKNTFVISTHMIDEIESFIDEAIFIKDGEVYHQIYRGNMTKEQMFGKISDTLTTIATGGDQNE